MYWYFGDECWFVLPQLPVRARGERPSLVAARALARQLARTCRVYRETPWPEEGSAVPWHADNKDVRARLRAEHSVRGGSPAHLSRAHPVLGGPWASQLARAALLCGAFRPRRRTRC